MSAVVFALLHCMVVMFWRFLPAFCPGFMPVRDPAADEDEGQVLRSKKGAGLRLELPVWLSAWDSYALAAAALGQVCFVVPIFFSLLHDGVMSDGVC